MQNVNMTSAWDIPGQPTPRSRPRPRQTHSTSHGTVTNPNNIASAPFSGYPASIPLDALNEFQDQLK